MQSPTELFISKSKLIHGDKFTYDNAIYVNAKTKVSVTCNTHGDFLISPNNHLNGGGCPKCRGRWTTLEEAHSEFINKANDIHQWKYDYSEVILNPKDKNHKIKIKCKLHGYFFQLPRAHVHNKSGCTECGKVTFHTKTNLGVDNFVAKARVVHGNKYAYDKVVYRHAHEKVIITCPLHGDFSITPANHWSAQVGCPSCYKCSSSKGEQAVKKWLDDNGYRYKCQMTFNGLIHVSPLKYDFYIKELNLLIEFDGEYHYIPITFSKKITAEEQFKLTQLRDQIKTEYAKTNGIHLLRIRYDDDITHILSNYFNKGGYPPPLFVNYQQYCEQCPM